MDVHGFVQDQHRRCFPDDASTLGDDNSRYQASEYTESVSHITSRSRAKKDRRIKPRSDRGRVHHDSKHDSKHDERSRRGEPSHGGRGSFAEPPPRKRSRSKTRTAHREHTRGIQPEPEQDRECDSDESFEQPVEPRTMKTRNECRITMPSSPTRDRFLNSGSSSGRAGHYKQAGLDPPLNTASRVSTQHGSSYDDYYNAIRHDQYANPVHLRNPEPDYVPPPLSERMDYSIPAQYGQPGNQGFPVRNPEANYVPPPLMERTNYNNSAQYGHPGNQGFPVRNPELVYIPPPISVRAPYYVPAQHGQHANQAPIRNPEPEHVPLRQIEGSGRHHRLLEAPSHTGSRHHRHRDRH